MAHVISLFCSIYGLKLSHIHFRQYQVGYTDRQTNIHSTRIIYLYPGHLFSLAYKKFGKFLRRIKRLEERKSWQKYIERSANTMTFSGAVKVLCAPADATNALHLRIFVCSCGKLIYINILLDWIIQVYRR